MQRSSGRECGASGQKVTQIIAGPLTLREQRRHSIDGTLRNPQPMQGFRMPTDNDGPDNSKMSVDAGAGGEKVCPRCAETVKAAALVCRFCNYDFSTPVHPTAPSQAASPDIVAPPPKQHSIATGCGLVAVLAAVILIIVAFFTASNDSSPTIATGPASSQDEDCSSNWTKCADNEQLVNSYSGWPKVRVDCQQEATAEARYGSPVWPSWPWIPFGSFLKGKDYVTSGTAVAVEPDAQFQNEFGAMVHSRVTCQYDLRAERE